MDNPDTQPQPQETYKGHTVGLRVVGCRGDGGVYSEVQGNWKVTDETRSCKKMGNEQEGAGPAEPTQLEDAAPGGRG